MKTLAKSLIQPQIKPKTQKKNNKGEHAYDLFGLGWGFSHRPRNLIDLKGSENRSFPLRNFA